MALIFFILFISLGLWQLERAGYKRNLHQSFLDKQDIPAVGIEEILAIETQNGKIWRRVEADGWFDENRQVLLDNQVLNNQAGYFVYTPFTPRGIDAAVLVNRGWVEIGTDRSVLPEFKKTNSMVVIKGLVKDPPQMGILLKQLSPEKLDKNTVRVQKLEIKPLQKLIGGELLPFVIRLTPDSGHGYKRDWNPPASGEKVHTGYAFQWFAFATTLLVIYLVINIKRNKHV